MSQQPKISVLLPTRGRTQALKESLTSLAKTAKDPLSVEILLAFDHDDQASSQWCQDNVLPLLDDYGVHYTLYGFERLGYIRLNEYLNALAKHAQGQWLFFWGDDAIMLSEAWDQQIVTVDQFRVLRIPTHNMHPYAIFPIVPKKWFDMFGYISAHQLTDSWVSQIGYMLDIVKNIEVSVIHDRFDITGNNNDDTYNNRPMLEGNFKHPRDFNHASWRQRRFADCIKLCEYLESQGEDMSWFRGVMTGKQDPWAKMVSPEYDPNGQLTQFLPNR